MKKFETIENKIPSNKFVYYFTWLLVAFNFFRSLEHIFNEDGGANLLLVFHSIFIFLKPQII